jgi:hypothetical protein
MPDDDKTRAREALSPFLAAALRASTPAELSAGSVDARVPIDVRVGDIRRALAIYENDLDGDRLVEWIAEGRAARSRAGRPEEAAQTFALEVASANGGPPTSYRCADLDEVRVRIEEAAAASVAAMSEFLGDEGAAPGELEAQLGRQAFRRLTNQLSANPAEPARFDLPDRPWLRLSVAESS